MNRRSVLFTLVVGLFVTLGSSALADGMINTGDSLRVKSVGPFTAKVYSITHYMKERPPTKSKQAVMDADVDKEFRWQMRRDVDSDKIKNALREAFKLNGYGDTAKIEQFLAAFSGKEVKEWEDIKPPPPPSVTITYSTASKTVTLYVKGGSRSAVADPTLGFMKAVWSIWFGRIDQPSMGDQLISKL